MLEDKTFRNGSSPPSWTFEVWNFVHLTWINEWFCFFVPNLYQNRTRFRWDLANLGRLCSSLNFENFDFFGHVPKCPFLEPKYASTHLFLQNLNLQMRERQSHFQNEALCMWNLQILYFVYVICVTAWFCVYGPNFTFSRQKKQAAEI